MDLERLEARLARQFRARPKRLGKAKIVWRKTPLPLSEHVGVALEGDLARRERARLRAWPESLEEVVGGRLVEVVSFRWLRGTPIEFSAGVQVLDLGEHGYLCAWNECHAHLAVARLEPWQDELVLSAAVKQLLRENGRQHGLEMFASIPHETVNHQPGFLLEAVVKQALYDWLLWAIEQPSAPWPHNKRDMTPEEEWFDVARTGTVLTTGRRALRSWAALSDLRLQQRFDEWFEIAYEEVTA
jgi:hypothetical protein